MRSSTDLLTWTDLTIDNVNTFEDIANANPDGDNSATLIQVRVKHDPTTPKRFLRLKLSQ